MSLVFTVADEKNYMSVVWSAWYIVSVVTYLPYDNYIHILHFLPAKLD